MVPNCHEVADPLTQSKQCIMLWFCNCVLLMYSKPGATVLRQAQPKEKAFVLRSIVPSSAGRGGGASWSTSPGVVGMHVGFYRKGAVS